MKTTVEEAMKEWRRSKARVIWAKRKLKKAYDMEFDADIVLQQAREREAQ